jgi:pimeloyl-ACP methyl ester carboxylesterase
MSMHSTDEDVRSTTVTSDWTAEAPGSGEYADVNGMNLYYETHGAEQQGQVSAAAVEFMKDTPMYQLYQRVAPRPEDFPRLLDKIGESMSKDFDFSEEVRGLQVPTLIVAADADMAPPSHYVEVFELLDGGLRDGGWMGENRPKGGHALAILPGLTHYNIFSSPLFAATTLAFLDG